MKTKLRLHDKLCYVPDRADAKLHCCRCDVMPLLIASIDRATQFYLSIKLQSLVMFCVICTRSFHTTRCSLLDHSEKHNILACMYGQLTRKCIIMTTLRIPGSSYRSLMF